MSLYQESTVPAKQIQLPCQQIYNVVVGLRHVKTCHKTLIFGQLEQHHFSVIWQHCYASALCCKKQPDFEVSEILAWPASEVKQCTRDQTDRKKCIQHQRETGRRALKLDATASGVSPNNRPSFNVVYFCPNPYTLPALPWNLKHPPDITQNTIVKLSRP